MAQQSQTSDISSDFRDERKVAIFWDYENLAVPACADISESCQSISGVVSRYGRITDRRIYFNYLDKPQQGHWHKFDSSGFDLVNTPRRGNQKETLDKKLIADLWAFAWDNSKQDGNTGATKPCIVLLTGDGDYAYTLNKLRDRGVYCVVIHGLEGTVSSILQDSASVCLNFHKDVLRENAVKEEQTTTVGEATKTGLLPIANPKDTKECKAEFVSAGSNSEEIDSNANLLDNTTDDAKLLLKLISANETTDDWVTGAILGERFRDSIATGPSGFNTKSRFRAARDAAIARGWAERGWGKKYSSSSQRIDIVLDEQQRGPPPWVEYLRLTKIGQILVTVAPVGKNDDGVILEAKQMLTILLDKSTSSKNSDSVSDSTDPYNWVQGGQIGNGFRTIMANGDPRSAFVKAKNFAITRGWVEPGCRVILAGDQRAKVILSQDNLPLKAKRGEPYFRLTQSGLQFLTNGSQSEAEQQRSLNTEKAPEKDVAFSHVASELDVTCKFEVKCELEAGVSGNHKVEMAEEEDAFAIHSKEDSELETGIYRAPSAADKKKPDLHGASNAGMKIKSKLDADLARTSNADKESKIGPDLFRDAKMICEIMAENGAKNSWLAICENGASHSWMEGESIYKIFQEKPGVSFIKEVAKARFCRSSELAREFGWIERGWRILNGSAGIVVGNESISPSAMVGGNYFRLTQAGASAVKATSERDDMRSRSLFIKNIPRLVSASDLSRHLQTNFGCKILFAEGKDIHPPGKCAFWFIRVEVQSKSEAEMLIHLSKQSKLFLQGRQLEVYVDKHPVISQDRGRNSTFSCLGNLLEASKAGRAANSKRLFVKNISRATSIQRLVIFLETVLSCTVLRATLEKDAPPKHSNFYFARLELSESQAATNLINANSFDKLELDGRVLELLHDKFSETAISGDCIKFPNIFYDKNLSQKNQIQ